MSGSSNLNSFRDRGQVAVQLVSCGVLLPGLVQDCTQHSCVDKFTYLGSSIESTEKDIETRLTKAWTAIDRLSIIWKSDLADKMKRSFFQAGVTSILLYGCTTWTLTKRLEKKLDGNYSQYITVPNSNSFVDLFILIYIYIYIYIHNEEL